MLISKSYLKDNANLHSKPGYGSSGHLWLGHVLELAEQFECKTVLDYGAGKATLGPYIERYGLEYTPYDPVTFPERPSKPDDMVVCLDVLEHIEPVCLPDVLKDIHTLSNTLVFFVVSTRPSTKTLKNGQNAHLIIKPWARWRGFLSKSKGGLWEAVRVRQHPDYFDFVGKT